MTDEEIPVVLVHGLSRDTGSMRPLAWRLQRAGFEPTCVGYPSVRLTAAEAVAHVREALAAFGGPIRVVGHSLGGLIGARLLRKGELPIRRVVQLGAPNLGSSVASRLGGTWPLRRLCGPALNDLAAHQDTPPPDARIGAIAGTLGVPLPGAPERPHDGAVSVRSAHAGAGHRATVAALHSFLPLSPAATRLTIAFLRDGVFPETA